MNIDIIRGAVLFLMLTPQTFPADLKLPRDGWVSWEVPAVEDAPDWCCLDWSGGQATPTACKLDSSDHGYSARDGATTDSVRVYARFSGGAIQRVRALSASCPVQTRTEIQQLGSVSEDDSARWLAGLIQPGDAEQLTPPDARRDALAALAAHRGDVAHDALARIARNDSRTKTRKEAVFWLAHLRGEKGAEIATAIMFGDEDDEVREHAAFAVSQSKSPDAASDLIRLANTDSDPDVRAQGWFWLAKTGSSATERAIDSALRKEINDDVRKRAIFALSQLPDERATKALIAVVRDQSRTSEDRKQAMFWLAQSESTTAQAYLDEILTVGER